jgi:hypothetical protein
MKRRQFITCFGATVAANTLTCSLAARAQQPAMPSGALSTTAAYRAKNNGMLGLSNGCITVDPVENNKLVTRLQGGALIYVTVGDDPIEQYL